MSKVSFEKCESYEYSKIYEIVDKQFSLFNIKEKLFEGAKVTVKPNLLLPKDSSCNITTNPLIIKAVCAWLKNNGNFNITVADSPGGLFTKSALERVYSACGLKTDGVEEYLNYDCSFVEVKTQDCFLERMYNIITPLATADFIVNLPKLKTHAMAMLSCGVKNMFGSIPGLQKPELHSKYPNERDFTKMLTELSMTVTPSFTLVDGVIGMEGNGPANGIQRKCGYIIASDNVFALDKAVCSFIGLPCNGVGTVITSEEYGLIDSIEVFGNPSIERPFLLPETVSVDFLSAIPKPLQKISGKILRTLLVSVPKINKKKCIGCGKCAQSCPEHIIKIENKIAKINTKNCISCFCCHEMCPVDAVLIKRNLNL